MARTPIRKSVRFEVLKRDSFTCQYCGASAPDVILHVDHIVPVAKGGGNEITNLIAACQGCNGGKSDKQLSDDSAITRQHKQLADLQERRNQLAMMAEWRQELKSLEDTEVEGLTAYYEHVTPGRTLNDHGKRSLKKLLRRHDASDVMTAIDIASETYYQHDDDGAVTIESAEKGLSKLLGILRNLNEPAWISDAFYANGIVRNRLDGRYYDQGAAIALIKAAMSHCDPASVVDFCKTIDTWTEFREGMMEAVEHA